MTRNPTERRSERLTELLRQNDPGVASPLDATERARLRSRMLAVLEDGRQPAAHRLARRWWVWSSAAAAAAVALLMIGWWQVPEDPVADRAPDSAPTTEAASRSEPRQGAFDQPAPRRGEPPLAGSTVSRPVSQATPEEMREPATLLAQASAPPQRATRERRRLEMRFVAPGGTRIIWALDPDLELTPATKGATG